MNVILASHFVTLSWPLLTDGLFFSAIITQMGVRNARS